MTKKVVLSFHDAAAEFQKEIENVMRFIPQKKSFLITPLWHGKGQLDKQFAGLMLNQDVLLHGLTHRSDYFDPYSILYMNKSLSREFLHLDHEATRSKIQLGINLFQDSIGYRPMGFIPPMWYHNRYTMTVLKEMSFLYTETWTRFVNLQNNDIFSSFPLSLDYGDNKILSSIYLKGWKRYLTFKKPSFIRLAIHPADLRNGMANKIKEMITRLEDDGYTFFTYSELLNQTGP